MELELSSIKNATIGLHETQLPVKFKKKKKKLRGTRVHGARVP